MSEMVHDLTEIALAGVPWAALTRHDTRVSPENENTAVLPGFPHPGPLPAGE